MKKIVAIGGGENGRPKSLDKNDGSKYPYELEKQDREIVNLTNKEHPNFLFLAHSLPTSEKQEIYFKIMVDIYEKRFGCICKDLKSDKLNDKEYVQNLVDWADIIYEGGGNTLDMIKLWKETGFDKILRKAWEDGKVMCGVSAGAICWFKECSSDSLRIKYGEDQPLISMECLGFMDGIFVPHADEGDREETAKEFLKNTDQIGILVSNCTALEIIDDKYRLITSDASFHNIKAYAKKAYYKDNEYIEEYIDDSDEFKDLSELYKR